MEEQVSEGYMLKVLYMEEAWAFINNLPLRVREKVNYNIRKVRRGIRNKELFKKLENTDIWEFRTLYEGNCYRLFAFWDADTQSLIVATHGIVKKSQKTPLREIRKAQELRRTYYENKQ